MKNILGQATIFTIMAIGVLLYNIIIVTGIVRK